MDERKFDVVVVGELNPDLILSGDVVPEFGQVEKLIDKAVLAIGSSSAIFACGAAKLGLKVAFIGKVGRDLFGQYMRQALQGYGIDIQGVIEDKDIPTGISVIFVKGGDRAILTFPGAIRLLKYGEINQDILRVSRHLHVGSYFIQEQLRPDLPKLFDRAHAWGLTISFDTNYDPKGEWDGGVVKLLEKADILLPNERECSAIAEKANLGTYLQDFTRKGKLLGVKQGEKGALLFVGEQEYRIEALKINVIDTVGAGDSFDAGFVYGFLAGWEPRRILQFANRCAGLSTRKAGGTAAQATLEEVLSDIKF
jgi:sugar/nucleoside kinase (ribokinase family)